MPLRLFLFAIGLVCCLAPARALEPLYVVHVSLHPATRELHVLSLLLDLVSEKNSR
jgi:hypothetical protein